MALGLDVELRDKDDKLLDMDDIARQTQKEEQRSMHTIRSMGEEKYQIEDNDDKDQDSLDQETAEELLN